MVSLSCLFGLSADLDNTCNGEAQQYAVRDLLDPHIELSLIKISPVSKQKKGLPETYVPMKTYTLSFGTVTLLRSDLAEVIVDEGIEMDMDMASEYHAFVSEHLADPCGALINKKNRYTYTFEAQLTLSTLKKIKATAVVVHSDAARIVTATLTKLPAPVQRNMKIFMNQEAGLKWLEEQLAG